VADVVWKGRLSWYGHVDDVERKDGEEWVSKCQRFRGMPKKIWEQSVKCNIRKYGMQRVEPFDKDKRRSCCESNSCKHGKKDVINC